MVFILWFCLFFLLYSFTFFWLFGYGINKCILVRCWLNIFVNFLFCSFAVGYSIVRFVYVYCLIHLSVAVFCLVFLPKSAAQFFSNVHVSFVFRGRSAVHFFFFSSFFNFSNAHVCFVVCHTSAVQFSCIFWVEKNFFS